MYGRVLIQGSEKGSIRHLAPGEESSCWQQQRLGQGSEYMLTRTAGQVNCKVNQDLGGGQMRRVIEF